MVDVASLALKVDSTQVKTADKALDGMSKSAKNAGNSAKAATPKMKGMSNTVNQLGYQLSDVAVQAQMGTNAFTIFAQQGGQFFGAINPIIGLAATLAGVLGGVLFNSLMAADEATEELSDSMQAAKDDIVAFTESVRNMTILEYQQQIVDLTGAIEDARQAVRTAKADDAIDIYSDLSEDVIKAEADLVDLETQLVVVQGQFSAVAESTADYSNNQDELDKQTRKTTIALKKQNAELEKLQALGDRVFDATRTEAEKVAITMSHLEMLLEKGVIDWDTYARATMDAMGELDASTKEAEDAIKELEKAEDRLFDSISSNIEDAITDFTSLGDVASSILKSIATAMVQKNITSPLSSALSDFDFGSLFSANAKGGVINEAGIVGTQGGKMAVAGEAGPEAILPLTRGSSGNLGVETSGIGGSNVVVNVINESGAETDVSESSGADGERIINVTVLKAVKSALSTGSLDRDFKTNFGLNRQGT